MIASLIFVHVWIDVCIIILRFIFVVAQKLGVISEFFLLELLLKGGVSPVLGEIGNGGEEIEEDEKVVAEGV